MLATRTDAPSDTSALIEDFAGDVEMVELGRDFACPGSFMSCSLLLGWSFVRVPSFCDILGFGARSLSGLGRCQHMALSSLFGSHS
jgi:hypothetical protein